MSKSDTLGSSFDQSRDIGNDKSLCSLQVYHSKIWIQCCEVVVG